jgi:hypothetical protein
MTPENENGAGQSAASNPIAKQDTKDDNTAANDLQTAALGYAKRGLSVFPVVVRGKIPLTANGFKDASIDPAQIGAWWQKHPVANIGIPTGQTNDFWVLDVDGADGEASLRNLETQHGTLPETVEVITGGGGRHLYFQWLSGMDFSISAGKLGTGLDVRGNGGYIVAPPSVHETGRHYEWSVDGGNQILPAPAWLVDLVTAQSKRKTATTHQEWNEKTQAIPEGQRNDVLTRFAGRLLNKGIDPLATLEMCQSWNQTQCNPPLDREEVQRIVQSIAGREHTKRSDKQWHEPFVANENDNTPSISYRNFADIQSKPIDWLWQGRIARGKVCMIAGDPGLGKSQVTASIAAIVTAEKCFPVSQAKAKRGNIIFLSAEDDAADTIKPRLEAAGADVSRIYILEAVKDSNTKGQRSFNLAKDIGKLEELLKEIGDVAVIFIDPITAYLGDTDSHKNAEIRALLTPLAEMAGRYGAAVICVSHLNKGGQSSALMRVTGSLAFVAAARCAYIVAKDPQNAERRYFLPLKNNIGNDKTGYAFGIQSRTLTDGIETSCVVWEHQEVDVPADQVLSNEGQSEGQPAIARNEASAFLMDLLSQGAIPVQQVFADGDNNGFSKQTLRRAKKDLGIRARKDGMDGGWIWELPKMTINGEDAHLRGMGIFGNNEHLRNDTETDVMGKQ